MKKALIVLGLEIAVLAVAVLGFLMNEGPGVVSPTSIRSAAATPALGSATAVVPVSISLAGPIGSVETAALPRGGHATVTARRGHVAVKVRGATTATARLTTNRVAGLAASRRARGPCC